MPRRLPVSLLAGLLLLVVPASASAKVNVAVGIGNQSVDMFASPLYKDLKLKRTRYFIEWNAISQPGEIAKADAFVNAARQNGVKVLMHVSADNINAHPRKPLPSLSAYGTKVKALIGRYKPLGVTDWGAWNEANHKSQPTAKNPTRAAQFFLKMRSLCSGCTIVALDLLDQQGVQSYIDRWFNALGRNRTKAKVIGIHNYSEVNRKLTKGSKRFPGTKRIIDATRAHNRAAKFWYTETGGLVKFGGDFPCDPGRAGNRTSYLFTLAKRYKRFIRRLYTYDWTPTPTCNNTTRFDAGIVNPNGSPRPAYNVIKSKLASFSR